jgi:hypothetical protein
MFSHPAFSWGATGHGIIGEVAITAMESEQKRFLAANKENIAFLINVPDREWKGKATSAQEKWLHYMNWDRYEETEVGSRMPLSLAETKKLVGLQFIQSAGASVWRVGQLYEKLVGAIHQAKCEEIIQMAGIMGHYVGDNSNPMHFSSDYDGGSIDRPGIHSYFETKLVEKQDRKELIARMQSEMRRPDRIPDGSGRSSAEALTFYAGSDAVRELPEIQAIFQQGSKKSGYDDQALAPYLPLLMGLGSATLATIWDQAFDEAGVTPDCPAQKLNVKTPAFFPLE